MWADATRVFIAAPHPHSPNVGLGTVTYGRRCQSSLNQRFLSFDPVIQTFSPAASGFFGLVPVEYFVLILFFLAMNVT